MRHAEIYVQLKRDLGSVAEPVALHAPVPPLLAGAWAILRETLVAGSVARSVKEAVAATVSARNRCPWCVDIHGMMLQASGHGTARLAIIGEQIESIADPALRAVATWADMPMLTAPPVASEARAEIVGTAVTFHYLNRMVNALLVESFLPKAGWARSGLRAALPWLLQPLARRAYTPGESLRWLPHAELPDDLGWAHGAPNVAYAFAGFTHAVEEQGDPILSAPARAVVLEYLASWGSGSYLTGTVQVVMIDKQPDAHLVQKLVFAKR